MYRKFPDPDAVIDDVLRGDCQRAALAWIEYLHLLRGTDADYETSEDEDWILSVFYSERLRSDSRSWALFLIECIRHAADEVDLSALAAGGVDDLLGTGDPPGIMLFRQVAESDPLVARVLRSAETGTWEKDFTVPD